MNKNQDCSVARTSFKKTELAEKMHLLNLPIEMIEEILSYLSYDELAKLRAVSKFFNTVCSQRLNRGFASLEQFHNKCLKAVKLRLPRRESERKNHPLARHSDILMAVETRLSMLNMTFIKYIEANQCCFIPGKVLDEAFRVLKIVKAHATTLEGPILPRPHDFLQEYRDISSMAMEHFDDKILPAIRERMRMENRLLFFKPKQMKNAVAGQSQLHALNVSVGPAYGDHQLVPVCSSRAQRTLALAACLEEGAGPSADVGGGAASTSTLVRMGYVLKELRTRCKENERQVARANRNATFVSSKLKSQSLIMQRKINKQKAMVKSLRKELRETRNAMSVMAKDLNRMKQDQSTTSGQPSCSNLTSCAVFSVSCLPEDKKQVQQPPGVVNTRGKKRKLEDKPEVPRKR